MKLMFCALLALACLAGMPVFAMGTDRDVDNDGVWDYDKGGTDRDVDNDGVWDYNKGGTDRDLDNDGIWDYRSTDRDHDGIRDL